MAKKEFITCDGHLVYQMYGDRYTLEAGKHEVSSLPKIGGDAGEADDVRARRLAQMLKKQFPQKITLSVEYDEPAVEETVEAAPPVPEAAVKEVPPAPKAEAKPAWSSKRAVNVKRGK